MSREPMPAAGFERALRDAIDAAPVVDPHTHLRPSKPEADNIADLVLYHHLWVELVSSGMPATATTNAGLPHELADPGVAPLDRVRAALPYLPHLRSTTCGALLRMMLEDLYHLPGGELTKSNLADTAAAVAERGSDPAWRFHVLKDRCRILNSLTVSGDRDVPYDESIGKGIEQNLNLISGKRTPQQALGDMERALDRGLRTATDVAEAFHQLGADYSKRPIHFVGLWLIPYFGYEMIPDQELSGLLGRVRAGRPITGGDLSAFTSYALRHFLAGLRTGPLRTIQLIVGAEVLPPHRSLTHWSPEFPGALGRLAGDYEDFHFSCSTASDLYTQDLAILAKHLPNISVAGYWWHTLYPFYIRKSIETRLDIVPANKIVAFFSDAYHAEWCYPKVKLVKRIFGDVLLDRVQQGMIAQDIALSLITQVFHDNPKRIYGIA